MRTSTWNYLWPVITATLLGIVAVEALPWPTSGFVLVTVWSWQAAQSRGVWRRLWVRWTARHALRQPLALNEDGELLIPVLLPGESCSIERERDAAGVRIVATVTRPNGSIRRQQEWRR